MLIGAHVSSSGGIHTAIDRAEAMGADAVQVFTQSPRAWRPTNHPPENFECFVERRAERLENPDLARGIRDVVFAAEDVCDAVEPVLDR